MTIPQVPGRLLHTSFSHCQPATSALFQSTSPDSTTSPAQYSWYSRAFSQVLCRCRRSDGLELTTRQSPWVTRHSVATVSDNWRRTNQGCQGLGLALALRLNFAALALTSMALAWPWLWMSWPWPWTCYWPWPWPGGLWLALWPWTVALLTSLELISTLPLEYTQRSRDMLHERAI